MSPPMSHTTPYNVKQNACGCRFVDYGNPAPGHGDVKWTYCPLHAHAPAMLEVLKLALTDWHSHGSNFHKPEPEYIKQARALLAQIEEG